MMVAKCLDNTDPSNKFAHTLYYVQDALYSTRALIASKWWLIEEQTAYDVYGSPLTWTSGDADADRDIDADDGSALSASYNESKCDPNYNWRCDINYDSNVNAFDLFPLATRHSSTPANQQSFFTNPYYFTGRRVDILDDGSLKIQYNRNRYYDYYTGRWTTHDPLGYVDEMNLYEYVSSGPTMLTDPSVNWESDMHFHETRCWALQIGFGDYCADLIATADLNVDVLTPASNTANQMYHFNGKTGLFGNYIPYAMGRDAHAEQRFAWAKDFLSSSVDPPIVYDALELVGQALHGFQDATAHRTGGQASVLDGRTHLARTAWEHVTKGPNSSDPHRPDSRIHFPNDWLDTSLDTKSKLEEIWGYCAVRCVCQ